MAGILKASGDFTITPHKVSMCILLQVYAPPAQISLSFPVTSVSKHNRLGVFLLALIKRYPDGQMPSPKTPTQNQQSRHSVGHLPLQMQQQQQPARHSASSSIVITTQWGTFNPVPAMPLPVPSATSKAASSTNNTAHPKFNWDLL